MKKFVKRVAFIVIAMCMVFTGLTFAGCGETVQGEFYSLQEAYDKGWLTQEDLLSIAYHYQGREDNEELMGEDYVPQPKTPETLSKQTEGSIKQTVLDEYNKGKEPGSEFYGTMDQVYIIGYYGTYNGCVSVKLDSAFWMYTQSLTMENIAGVNFYYNNGNRLRIWRATEDTPPADMDDVETVAGEFYTLQEAYDEGFLTQDDLLSIAYYYNHGKKNNEDLMGEDYTPKPIMPETLSKQTEKSIKQTELDKYNNGREPGSEYYGTLDQVYILGYYGTYNGCVAVKMDMYFYGHPGVEYTKQIEGVNFHEDGFGIKIWREKNEDTKAES